MTVEHLSHFQTAVSCHDTWLLCFVLFCQPLRPRNFAAQILLHVLCRKCCIWNIRRPLLALLAPHRFELHEMVVVTVSTILGWIVVANLVVLSMLSTL